MFRFVIGVVGLVACLVVHNWLAAVWAGAYAVEALSDALK